MRKLLRAWLTASIWLGFQAFVACGARTGLENPDPCTAEGAERACSDPCGAGTQTCTLGSWQACVVPVTSRPCSDACGTGQQQCQNKTWQTCVVPLATRDCSSVCGSGHETCSDGTWGPCDAPQPKPPVLHTTVRDFHRTQPDFELPISGNVDDRGIVQQRLGPDQKPVYNGMPTTRTTDGKANFDVWYRDTPGVNLSTPLDLQLTDSPAAPGLYVYDKRSFFPIDNQLFGNEGFPHNYHFTLESHTAFVYRGAEVFSFIGDDDMWVFINNLLAINLGGLHQSESADVSLDAIAPSFGLVVGNRYPIDLFFAERHTVDSDFTVRTTIADVGACN